MKLLYKNDSFLSPKVLALVNKIKLEPMSLSHVRDVAQLHYNLLSWSFNGQFGLDHMIEIYSAILKSSKSFGYVYYSNKKLIGFVTATSDLTDTRKYVVEVYKNKFFKTLSILLRNPKFVIGALESKFIVPMVFRHFGVKSEWLTFVTDTSNKSLSPIVALRLIEAVREHFMSLNVEAYMAQGVKNNPRAMRMYEKLNWQIVARLPIHNIYFYPTKSNYKE